MPTPDAPTPARRQTQLLRRLGLALLVVSSVVPLAHNVADSDLWGHVLYGQEWNAQGRLPRTATHTFTAVGHPWVNHENLAEQLLARGFPTLGVSGMLAAKVVLGMAMLLMMASVSRRQGARPMVTWAVLLTVAYALQGFFPLRPQLLSFLWCSVLLWLLDRAFAGWRRRRTDFTRRRRRSDPRPIDWRPLAAAPVLMAVWANSHGGFVFGLALLAAVLAGRAIELALRLRRAAVRAIAGLAAVLAVSAAGTLLNPYGWGLHAWLVESLGAARPEISEWRPPSPNNPVFAPFVVLLTLASVSLSASRRRRDPVQVVLLVLVAWQATLHLRHIALFAILCGFWLPPHTQSALRRALRQLRSTFPTSRGRRASPSVRRATLAVVAGAIALQANVLGGRLAGLPVHRSNWPVDALQWMADHRVRGDLLVNFNWAQYALAALGPDVRVAFDGRFRTCYPQTVIDRHFDFLLAESQPRWRDPESGPVDSERAVRGDRPDYVLIDRRYAEPVSVMERISAESGSDWTLIYQDAIAQVWGRRSIVDDTASARHVPEGRRFVSNHFSLTAVDWPATPRRDRLTTPKNTAGVSRRSADPGPPSTDAG